MDCLVIGSGGREHAIIDKLSESKLIDKIYVAPGNDGMLNATRVNINVLDNDKLLAFVKNNNIGLTVVGPEVALANGIVDLFRKNNLKIFGPTKEASKIETSKDFAKKLMKKYNVKTADYKSFSDYETAVNYIKDKSFPLVIKYDGLAAGKGVVIAHSFLEGEKALKDMLTDNLYGKDSVVIEEFLEGIEFSFMCFVDNDKVYPMQISQDHKRAYDNDLGPNTGGMGAYTSVPVISDEDTKDALEKIVKPIAKALVNEGKPFSGVLYAGLIKTKDSIKVIEFNARFGDPETEVVLPKLKSDLAEVFLNIIDHKDVSLAWDNLYYVGIVMASKGYPKQYEKGFLIEGLDKVKGQVFHMGTKKLDKMYYTNGGRVLIVVESSTTLKEAKEKALVDCRLIKCDNLFYRKDIAHWSL